MEAINEYVNFCRIVGPWTDWFQGPGGNLSVKSSSRTHMFIKQSGVRIVDTTPEHGWMLCYVDALRECLETGSEDFSKAVTLRAPNASANAKPSMEAVLHTLPPKYILHAHPTPLMNQLCAANSIFTIPSVTVPYAKPGIPLAQSLQKVYDPSISIYFLRNHGVLICGETVGEILVKMNTIRLHCFPEGVYTQVLTAAEIALKSTKQPLLLLPTFQVSPIQHIQPFTPDLAVFFQHPILCCTEFEPIVYPSHPLQVVSIDKHLYVVGETLEQCHILQELLQAYLSVSVDTLQALPYSEVLSLRGWDKEKERVQNAR